MVKRDLTADQLAAARGNPAYHYVVWDTSDIVDTPTRWEMTLRLTPGATKSDCSVDVTPRRRQQFKAAKGQRVRWSIEGGPSGEAAADRWDLITVPSVRVAKSGTRLRIEKVERGDEESR